MTILAQYNIKPDNYPAQLRNLNRADSTRKGGNGDGIALNTDKEVMTFVSFF